MDSDLAAWVGRSEQSADVLEPARSTALRASVSDTAAPAAGDELPPLHHWLYFWKVPPPAGLGADGHPAKGDFLPPIPLPRRMWAGGRLRFLKALCFREHVTRTSTIRAIEAKSGKTGNLVFVTVEHVISGEAGTAIVEEQDLVYRGTPTAAAIDLPPPTPAPPAAAWHREIVPDPVLLFRYSALTMNAHRIHYDRRYAIEEEAYPGLVVQGPLQATLLADLAVQRLGGPLATFDFRGIAPAFEGDRLHICGGPEETGATLWTQQGGRVTMRATATRT